MENFVEHFLPGVHTPIMLPAKYVLVRGGGDKIAYVNASGETVEHYTYMDHAGQSVIVDEFRKLFPHDSILVVLFGGQKNLYLQKRSMAMRWEPNKIDLASVAAQRRAQLVYNHFKAVNLHNLALAKVAEETGLPETYISADNLTFIGTHENVSTNEFQTIYAYHLEADARQLNTALAQVDDIYKAQSWEKRPYALVLEQYFGEGVTEYAGGAGLRPRNFISTIAIRERLDSIVL